MKASRVLRFGPPNVIMNDDLLPPEPAAGPRQHAAGRRTEETIPMRLTWRSDSALRIEADAANIFDRPFLSDNLSWDKGWIGYHGVY